MTGLALFPSLLKVVVLGCQELDGSGLLDVSGTVTL